MDNKGGDYGTDAPYTKQDRSLLRQVRDDIMKHPEDYREGAAYLKQEFGPEKRHAYALANWEKWKNEPAQKMAWKAQADLQSADIADNAKRRRYRGKVLRELMAPPRLDDWPLSRCFCTVTEALFRATGSGCDDATAQAVLLLAVMLWDQQAETRHDLFTLFGTWDERWMATDLVHESDRLKVWMNNVDGALDILPRVGPRVRQAMAAAIVTADAAQTPNAETAAGDQVFDIDDFDLNILKYLAKKRTAQAHEDIAAACGLVRTTVNQRLKNLRKQGLTAKGTNGEIIASVGKAWLDKNASETHLKSNT